MKKKRSRLRKTREGRDLVERDAPTALSRFRSHRSLIMHPAPRMINAPVPKRRMYFRGTDGGTLCAYDAMVIDQANNNSEWLDPTLPEEAAERRTAGIE